MRPAEAERHAEALRVADDDVGAHLARRRQQRQRQQVGGDGDERRPPRAPASMNGRRSSTRAALRPGYCSSTPNTRASNVMSAIEPTLQLDAERLGAAAQHRDRLRKAAIRHQEHAAVSAQLLRLHAVQQRHRLAAAVASSSSDALATSIPVRSVTIVWKLSSDSRRPCAISAW